MPYYRHISITHSLERITLSPLSRNLSKLGSSLHLTRLSSRWVREMRESAPPLHFFRFLSIGNKYSVLIFHKE